MTISVGQPVISARVHYAQDGITASIPVPEPMRICTIPVSFNGSLTEAVAHAVSVNGVAIPDDAPLKWANFLGTSRPLVGGQTVSLGLFEIHDDGVYLHSLSDSFPKKPFILAPGSYELEFRIDSADHRIRFKVIFTYADHMAALA